MRINKLILEDVLTVSTASLFVHQNGIIYKKSGINFTGKATQKVDNDDKRKFFKRLFIGVVGLSEFLRAQVKVIPKKNSTIPVIKKVYPSPPGSAKC